MLIMLEKLWMKEVSLIVKSLNIKMISMFELQEIICGLAC